MKTIIAGGRDITDEKILFRALKEFNLNISEVVCGMARGADMLGHNHAASLDIPLKEFPADWNTHRKAAGIRRNIEMGKYANQLLALWDGKSKGTQHMITYMQSLNKPVFIYRTDK